MDEMQIMQANELLQNADSLGIENVPLNAARALTTHWPEYLIEAACLGLFMLSACSFTVLLHHPGSVVRQMLPSVFLRRLATGIAMGLTAVAIIYSPWGKQSGG